MSEPMTDSQYAKLQEWFGNAIALYIAKEEALGIFCFRDEDTNLAMVELEHWHGPATDRYLRRPHTHTLECWCRTDK